MDRRFQIDYGRDHSVDVLHIEILLSLIDALNHVFDLV